MTPSASVKSIAQEIRHEAERGLMLKLLADWQMEWMPFHELRVQLMARLGYNVRDDQVLFHLNYLVQSGYAESKQLRAGRADFGLTAVRATPKAIDLGEGRSAPDPGIAL